MSVLLCSILTAVLYLTAANLAAYQLKHPTPLISRGARAVFFLALIMHSVVIGLSSVFSNGTLLQGPNVLMLASWVLAIGFAFFEVIVNKPYGYRAFVSAVIALLVITAELLGTFSQGAELYNRVYNEWPLLVGHILCFFVAISCSVISAIANGMLLYQQRLMKKKREMVLGLQMPPLSSLKKVAGISVFLGMPFLSAGMLIGFVRYSVLLGSMTTMGCVGDLSYLVPRIVLSIIVFVLYCIYLALIYLFTGRASSKTTAWLSIVAGISTIVLAIISSTAVI